MLKMPRRILPFEGRNGILLLGKKTGQDGESATKRCIIITGGTYAPIGPTETDDFIIACDSGFLHAQKEGIVPDLLIGDFDSYTRPLPAGIPVKHLPIEKDDTDTMYAVRWASAHGYDTVRLCCAFGGSLDHLLANIQTLHFAVNAGMAASAGDERTELRVFGPGRWSVPEKKGWTLSIFALTDTIENLTISGAKYTLSNADLFNYCPLGISNAFRGSAEISFTHGVAAVLLCRREE